MSELERIRNIVTPIAQKHGVEKVWLFGTRTRGEARPNCDYLGRYCDEYMGL